MTLQLLLLLLINAQIISCNVKVDSDILNGYTGPVILETNAPIMEKIGKLNRNQYPDHAEQANYVQTTLAAFTTDYTAPIVQLLNTYNVSFFVSFISNVICFTLTDTKIVQILIFSLSSLIATIRKEVPFSIPNVIINNANAPIPTMKTPNLQQIGATTIQKGCANGTGILVATIDTGVRATHQELRNNFLGVEKNGWLDCLNTSQPVDNVGHGTHTMGIFVGGLFTGVAPNATWMTCRACNEINCPECCLVKCATLLVCPPNQNGTNNMCTSTPKIVSNSWGSSQGNVTWFDSLIAAYDKCRIALIFAAGNSGNATANPCKTVGSPADRDLVVAVGACNSTSGVEGFSSCGPPIANNSVIKPDNCAPGSYITSSYKGSDTAYAVLSGTSMATPGVAGALALIYSMGPSYANASFNRYANLLRYTCCRPIALPTVNNCGTLPGDPNVNNVAGWGRLDVIGIFKDCFKLCPNVTLLTSCSDVPKPTVIDYCPLITNVTRQMFKN